jgi:serine/threonine-protein kinase
MYEMITGRAPFNGDNPVNIALMHINGEMIPPSKLVDGVPPALEHIILKCTDKYPVNRYSSAEELIEALNNLEFVGSVVGNSVLMGNKNAVASRGPIAETNYDDGEEVEEENKKKKKAKKDKKESEDDGKKKKMIIIIAAVVAAIVLGLAACFATGVIGGKEIDAPNFKNMTFEEAQRAAEEDYDIKIKMGDEVISEDVEKGRIVSQDPVAGTKIKTGSTITVNISKGLGEGEVPDLSGKDLSDLEAYLSAAGFTLGSVKERASDEPEGTVLNQDPAPGSNLEKGSAINVVVSDGSKAKASVPYLIGKTIGEAEQALRDAGLSRGTVSYDYSNTYAEGEVMWQQYEPGAPLDRGTSVKIRVSKGPEPTPTQPPTSSIGDDEDDD